MYKHLLTVPTLLIVLTLAAQPVSANTTASVTVTTSVSTSTTTAPVAPTPKKYYELWNRITLRDILRQRASTTPTAGPTAKPTATPTPTPKAVSTVVKTPTPTMKQASPTPTRVPTKTPTPAPAAVTTNEVTDYIMKEINAYRASLGLSAVKTSAETCNFAKIRAQEISTSFNHDGFNNRKNAGTLPYASWTAITENIAMTSNYKNVETMWQNSAGHAANMRANTPYVCVMQYGNYFAYEGMKP